MVKLPHMERFCNELPDSSREFKIAICVKFQNEKYNLIWKFSSRLNFTSNIFFSSFDRLTANLCLLYIKIEWTACVLQFHTKPCASFGLTNPSIVYFIHSGQIFHFNRLLWHFTANIATLHGSKISLSIIISPAKFFYQLKWWLSICT